MRKSTISGLWIAGLAGMVAGGVGIAIGTVLLLAYGGTYDGGSSAGQFTPTLNAFFWWMVALITAGALVVVAGGIVQVVSWIGALLNVYALADKTWFIVLLIAGAIGLVGVAVAGFVAMVVYLLIGPDSTAPAGAGTTAVPPPVTLAPAS